MTELDPTEGAVAGIVVMLLLSTGLFVLARLARLPFSALLVVGGMALGWFSREYPGLMGFVHNVDLSSGIILYVFLPTLIFEAAFSLDGRQLRHNIGAVLLLAVPGLFISTLLISLVVGYAVGLPVLSALLIGAILSATDPVAVVALFRQVGAPQRLIVMMEGESLLNDATAIVLARILILALAAGSLTGEAILHGSADFFLVFGGGVIVGWLLGRIMGYLIGLIAADSFLEITLSTVAAYLSFLVAEKLLHVSGVMATMAAGLVLGGWGRPKISQSVRAYMEHFWKYLAAFANALIFILVGMSVEPSTLMAAGWPIFWVIVAMLVSRAVVIFGMLPLVGRIPGGQPVSKAYQTVMFWGGQRGAIALALALSLPGFPGSGMFVTLVMGAVLFTLLVQGPTIEPLLRYLGLDKPVLADRLAREEQGIEARQQALDHIPALLSGGLFSGSIARRLRRECEHDIEHHRHGIGEMRTKELNPEIELQLLYMRALGEEKSAYADMFSKGLLSEGTYRELDMTLDRQIDAIRYHGKLEHIQAHRIQLALEPKFIGLLDRLPLLNRLSEFLRQLRIVRSYEEAWGHSFGSRQVLAYLDALAKREAIPWHLLHSVESHYRHWQEQAQHKLDQISEFYPAFVSSMQWQLGKRLQLLSEVEAAEKLARRGLSASGMAENLRLDALRQLAGLRSHATASLKVSPLELLRKVHLFRGLSKEEQDRVSECLQPHTVLEGETIFREGEPGDAMYLIARGVVRIVHEEDKFDQLLSTLVAGDHFGETTLLGGELRHATARAVTPCSLFKLTRADLEKLMKEMPTLRTVLERST